jgi:pimeloyl-ACP methyl ester carboxylesterase
MRIRWLWAAPLLVGLVVLVDRSSGRPPPHHAERLRAGDVDVRTVRAGEGDTTVLLLHGYAESLMAFRPSFDILAAKTRAVAIDLPGFGLSDKPTGSYDLASYVQRVSAFIDQHLSGPVVLVGHSMGGAVAAGVALERPDRVVGLVLIAAAGNGLSPAVESITRQGADVMGWINAAVGELVVPLHDPDWLAEPDEWRHYDPLLDPAFRSASAEVLRQFDFAGLRTSFGNIEQPTLLIWGQRDPTIPLEFGEAMNDSIPCSRLLVIRRALHRPHQTEPDLVAAQIAGFIKAPDDVCLGSPDSVSVLEQP